MSSKSPATATSSNTPGSRRLAYTAAYLGWMFDGYENFATVLVVAAIVNDFFRTAPGLAEGALPSTQWPLLTAVILAVTLVSWAVGGLISGVLADRYGRKRVMFWAILWYAVCAGLTALSPNFAIFLVLRFITGIGMGAEWGGGSSLVSENSNVKTRGFRIAFLQGAFGVGFLLATLAWQLVNHGGQGDWRWMYVIGVIPALITVFLRSRVKDPARWVASDRNRRVVVAAIEAGRTVSTEASRLTRSPWNQLWSEAVYVKRVVLLFVLAVCSMIGWWAVSTWIPQFSAGTIMQFDGGSATAPSGATIPNAGWITLILLSYNIAGIIGYMVMGWLSDVIGRKKTLILFMLASFVVTPLFFLVAPSFGMMMVLVFVNGFFTLGQMAWLPMYPSELFPTRIRATGMSAVFNLARFPAAAATLVAGSIVPLFGQGAPAIAMAATVIGMACYLIGAIVVPFVGPETKGQPLIDDTPEEVHALVEEHELAEQK